VYAERSVVFNNIHFYEKEIKGGKEKVQMVHVDMFDVTNSIDDFGRHMRFDYKRMHGSPVLNK